MVQPVSDDSLRDLLTTLTVFDTLDEDEDDEHKGTNKEKRDDGSMDDALDQSSMLITKELAKHILKRAAKVELSNEGSPPSPPPSSPFLPPPSTHTTPPTNTHTIMHLTSITIYLSLII